MKLKTPSERFFLFMATTMMFAYACQHFINYQNDKLINDAMEMHNESVKKYSNMLDTSQKENSGLKHDLLHAQVENESLAKQVDHVINYYQVEVIKLKDQILDLKYGKKN
jgi:hypothetical protein